MTRREYMAAYRQAHKSEIDAKQAAYRQAHKSERAAYRQAHKVDRHRPREEILQAIARKYSKEAV